MTDLIAAPVGLRRVRDRLAGPPGSLPRPGRSRKLSPFSQPGRTASPASSRRNSLTNPRIAEHVYGDRMGNGPGGSGDGWAYRGGGIFQLTGKAAYAAAGKRLVIGLEARPDLITDPLIAARTAGDFWRESGLGAKADAGDFVGLTRRINPGLLGMASRQMYFAAFKEGLVV